MLWRPDATSLDTTLDSSLWRRSTLARRAHGWYVSLQPEGPGVTFEVGEQAVIAYADGRVAGHAVLDDEGTLLITVGPEFAGRGIEDELVAQTTRISGVRFRERARPARRISSWRSPRSSRPSA